MNDSHWFDYKNEPIKLSADESSWWPWLVVDPLTYAQGSCVAKRSGALFLDDCYKRMSFACQSLAQVSVDAGDELASSSSISSISSSDSNSKNETASLPRVEMVLVSSGEIVSSAVTGGLERLSSQVKSATSVSRVEGQQSSDSSDYFFVNSKFNKNFKEGFLMMFNLIFKVLLLGLFV